MLKVLTSNKGGRQRGCQWFYTNMRINKGTMEGAIGRPLTSTYWLVHEQSRVNGFANFKGLTSRSSRVNDWKIENPLWSCLPEAKCHVCPLEGGVTVDWSNWASVTGARGGRRDAAVSSLNTALPLISAHCVPGTNMYQATWHVTRSWPIEPRLQTSWRPGPPVRGQGHQLETSVFRAWPEQPVLTSLWGNKNLETAHIWLFFKPLPLLGTGATKCRRGGSRDRSIRGRLMSDWGQRLKDESQVTG